MASWSDITSQGKEQLNLRNHGDVLHHPDCGRRGGGAGAADPALCHVQELQLTETEGSRHRGTGTYSFSGSLRPNSAEVTNFTQIWPTFSLNKHCSSYINLPPIGIRKIIYPCIEDNRHRLHQGDSGHELSHPQRRPHTHLITDNERAKPPNRQGK